MTPRVQRQKTLETIVELTVGLASLKPLFLVVEDVHWIDPSTRELLDLFIDKIGPVRVLMVITHRPGFTPLWAGRGPVTALSLSRLSPTECEELIRPLVGGKTLPREVMNQIVARTEGVPLFVEELTKTIRESGLLADEGDRYEVTSHHLPLEIPATLRDSLVARLDRLGSIKEVAQIGAAIGREFPYALLAAVSATAPAGSLERSLGTLESAELVYRTGVTPEAVYRFKHALVQEAAHESLIKSRRQELHGRIAEVLEQEYPDRTRMEPEVLARHYAEAGMIDKGVDYWLMAGHRAIEHSANLEASSHFTRGLALLQGAPLTVERSRKELALQIGRGIASIAVKGYAAPETGEAYRRARDLCSTLGATRELFQTLFGLWGHHWVRAELHEAHRLALDIESQARLQADQVPTIVAHRVLGSTLFTLGDFIAAREQLEKTLDLSGIEDGQRLAALYAVEPRVAALLIRAWVLWMLGYPYTALRSAQDGQAAAEQITHAYSLAFAAFVVSAIHSMRGEVEAARAHAEACMAISDEHQITQYATLSRVLRGWSLVHLGQREGGLAEINANITHSRRTGVAFMRSWMLGAFAESYAEAGNAVRAHETIDEALKHVERTGERLWEAELYRLRGEMALVLSPEESDRAQASLLHALEVARQQGAKSLELRAATSVAVLWRRQGRATDARALLAPVYDWFTEGFETADLRKARAVLDSLG
jgi:predicted ATPase